MGRCSSTSLATFAEFESDLIRLRTREGDGRRPGEGKLRGKKPQALPPTGPGSCDACTTRVASTPTATSGPRLHFAPAAHRAARLLPERHAGKGGQHTASLAEGDAVAGIHREAPARLELAVLRAQRPRVACAPQLLGGAPRTPPLRRDRQREPRPDWLGLTRMAPLAPHSGSPMPRGPGVFSRVLQY